MCHQRGDIHSLNEELLAKATKNIDQSGYIPSENDLEFIRTYT